MATQTLPVVNMKPLERGSDGYEEKRQTFLEDFGRKVPKEYHLPRDIVENPPLDVTGIPRQSGILSQKELDITEKYSATGLARAIASRKLSAVEVARAFSKRAIIAHQVTSCLIEWFMDEALTQAMALDDYMEQTGKPVGPLHGVPISVKCMVPVAGTISDLGALVAQKLDANDCCIISILRRLGAVFYVKTNQPQALMHPESSSYAGRTLNPFNTKLTCGGSSGGEAALLAMRGSVLGIGTDIGGSIRVPSGFCGLYGFKPTSYILPTKDFVPEGFPAELNILASVGPMCHTLEDMDLFMSGIKSEKPWLQDVRLVPLPWNGTATALPNKPLKVGFIMNDGLIRPQPPVRRALEWAHDKLIKGGLSEKFQVKSFKPFKAAEAFAMVRQMYFPQGRDAMRDGFLASGEPLHPLTEWALKDSSSTQLDCLALNSQRAARDRFRWDFADHWNEQDVDVVIAPLFVGPAPAHDTAFYWNYTSYWNLIDYPAAVFPTPIIVQKGESYSAEDATPLGEECAHVRKLWEEGDAEGAPVALQIVARKYHDSELFGALAALKAPLGLP